MSKYMNDNQIQHELTAPYSPAQNGKAERFNRTLVEMTKSLLKHIPSLAPELWPYAVDHATWLYNRIPQEGLEKKAHMISSILIVLISQTSNLSEQNVGTMTHPQRTRRQMIKENQEFT